jgi:protein-disulfide isomerase
MFKAVTSLILTFLIFNLVGCSEGTSKPSYLFKQASEEGLAGQVGDVKITHEELLDGIEADVFEAESKVFEIKFNKLKSLIIQKMIDKDPRKKELSNDEFLEKYISSKVSITEKQIDQFIKKQNIPQEHINPQVREKIKNYLMMEDKKNAIENWLAEQTKKTPVEVFIAKPRRPTFPIEVGDAPSFGNKEAKVTIVEFSDFQCPFCAKGADILKELKAKYGNKIRVAFKNFPLPFHNHAEKAANAGLCANEQSSEKFWKLHDEMFSHQDSLDPEGLKKAASKIGLKVDQFSKCLDENKYISQVQSQMEEGKKIKVKSTPTFFINGQLVNGAQPVEVFSEIIDEELSKK